MTPRPGPARSLRLVVALALVASAALVLPGPGAAATTRVLTINNASAHPAVAFQGFDGNPPKLYDIDGDGDKEIIAQNDNQYVYVFDSRSGAILAQMKTTLPSYWGARSFNGPEVSLLTQGGTPRLVVMNSAATVTMFRFDAASSTPTQLGFVKEWERRLSDCHGEPGADSKPVLADLDGDGTMEILLSTEELGVYALRANGAILWKQCIGGGNAEPVVTDLDLDGRLDVVFGSDGGVVTAMNGQTGAIKWSYYLPAHFQVGSGSMPVGVGIGQVDGVGGPDIVVGARDSHNGTDFSQDHAVLVALSSSGRLLWSYQDPQGAPLTYTHALVLDADRNGVNEIYWADWNTIGHKPPANEADAWKVTGPAHFYRFDSTGSVVWKQTMGTFWNNKDLALADVDHDGVQEVLANGPGANGHDGIWYLDSRTGAKESFVDTWPFKVAREPVLADLWGTGTMQWVVEVGQYDPSAGGSGLLVYDTQSPYDAAYPHMPDPSFGVPPPPPTWSPGPSPTGLPPPSTSPTPPPSPTPVGSGVFSSKFTVRLSSATHEEVLVQPTTAHTLAGVFVRINNGTWQPLAKQTTGYWTGSYAAAAGSRVEFLARDTSNFVSLSQPFKWMSPPTTLGSTVPPGMTPPAFSGTYYIRSSTASHEEMRLVPAGAHTITRMEVRIGGSAWKPMAYQTTGYYVANLPAPKGTWVDFRATDSNGEQSQSAPFNWLDGTTSKPSVTPGTPQPSPNPTTPPPTTPPPTSPPPTTPPAGSFAPTFSVPSSVNEWWVEVHIQTSDSVSSADARVNGGTWTPLTKQSWGNWAKSFHVPAGSKVEFRAIRSDGAQATSQPFTWLGGNPGSFAATFTPKSVGNDYWVEVDVGANHALAKVEARLGASGTWQALDKQSWGSWAKSLHAPNGTQVTFRATDTAGATVTSQTVTWT